jgi:hypothetical protein
MHPPITVPPTSWEKTILKWALIALAAFFVGGTALHEYDDYRLARAERALAEAGCVTRADRDTCRRKLDDHHARCFDPNNHVGRDRFSWGSFDRDQYRRCLDIGPEAWRLEQARRQVEELKRRRSALD